MERELPYSLEAEQCVLGSIILEPTLISMASKRINTDVFYKEVHKIIFENMIELHKEGKKADLISVVDKLKSNEYLDKIGGMSYITGLQTIVPSVTSINYYIDMLIDKRARRASISVLDELYDKMYSGELESLRSGVESLKSVLTNNKSTKELYTDAADIKKRDTANDFLDTGIASLNKILGGGIAFSTLNIITGSPGSGKSTLLNQIIAKSIKDNQKCFLYSGELRNDRLMAWFKRTVANANHIIQKTNKNGDRYYDISDYSWDIISNWVRGKFKIFNKDAAATKDSLLSVIENLIVHENYKLFILDNLMTIDIGDSDRQYQNQKQLCIALKSLVDKYGVSIILVAHPKKVKEGVKATMYDISGASEIVNLADNIFRMERKSNIGNDGEENNLSKIEIQKNRWGGIVDRAITLQFDDYRKRFYQTEAELNIDYGYDTNKKFEQVDVGDIPF